MLVPVLIFAFLMARPCTALDLVRNGRPLTSIVLPARPLPAARIKLKEFRDRNGEDCISDFGVLSTYENRVWKRLDR